MGGRTGGRRYRRTSCGWVRFRDCGTTSSDKCAGSEAGCDDTVELQYLLWWAGTLCLLSWCEFHVEERGERGGETGGGRGRERERERENDLSLSDDAKKITMNSCYFLPPSTHDRHRIRSVGYECQSGIISLIIHAVESFKDFKPSPNQHGSGRWAGF